MPTYRFDEIASRRVKKYKDPETGKTRQVTMKFSQTVNPFNTDYRKKVKSIALIEAQNEAEAKVWVERDGVAPLTRAERDRIHLMVEMDHYRKLAHTGHNDGII